MDAAAWDVSDNPGEMLEWLTRDRSIGYPSDRRLRLFAEAVTGISAWANMGDDFDWADFSLVLTRPDSSSRPDLHPPPEVMAAYIRCIFANPFRPVTLCTPACPDQEEGYHAPACPVTPTVLALAQSAYDDRLSDGLLDGDRLMVLADALEESGCTDAAILDHLRETTRRVYCDGKRTNRGYCVGALCPQCGGNGYRMEKVVHARGCHVLDAIMGRS